MNSLKHRWAFTYISYLNFNFFFFAAAELLFIIFLKSVATVACCCQLTTLGSELLIIEIDHKINQLINLNYKTKLPLITGLSFLNQLYALSFWPLIRFFQIL